jgi:hypothetical protein
MDDKIICGGHGSNSRYSKHFKTTLLLSSVKNEQALMNAPLWMDGTWT